jgi:hypothetical protein
MEDLNTTPMIRFFRGSRSKNMIKLLFDEAMEDLTTKLIICTIDREDLMKKDLYDNW